MEANHKEPLAGKLDPLCVKPHGQGFDLLRQRSLLSNPRGLQQLSIQGGQGTGVTGQIGTKDKWGEDRRAGR